MYKSLMASTKSAKTIYNCMNFNKKKEFQLKIIMLVSLFEFVPKTPTPQGKSFIHSFIENFFFF